MIKIEYYVDKIIQMCGLTGMSVTVARFILLVLVAVVLASVAGILFRKIVTPIVRNITARTKVTWDDILLGDDILKAASRIVPAVVVWVLLPMIFTRFDTVHEILERATAVYITVMSVNLAIVFINSLKLLGNNINSSTQQYFHSFCGVLKIVMIFIAVIAVVAIIIDKSPTKLFAGLGATSAIMMLVFKDTISGLVAGIRLTSNNMMRKGDWITVPKAGADGTVEDITLTTVKVRNFDNTIVTVTPQTLVDDSFKNWIGMQNSDGRRVARKIYYDFNHIHPAGRELCDRLVEKGYFNAGEITPDTVNLTLFRRYAERYLAGHPEVNSSMTIMVHQLEPASLGLPVEFYFFLGDKEWLNYEHNRDDIFEYIYAITPDFGLKIYQQYIGREA